MLSNRATKTFIKLVDFLDKFFSHFCLSHGIKLGLQKENVIKRDINICVTIGGIISPGGIPFAIIKI